MYVIDIVILVGWAAFWIYWLVASVGVKSGRTRWGRLAGSRVVLILVLLLFVRLRFFKGRHPVVSDPLLQGIGFILFVLGLALAIWARVYLGRNWGMPMTEKADPELVTTGPYSSIRHPIYSGIILAMIGTALAVSLYGLIAVVLIGGYFIYSAVMEERYMARILPDTYPRYREETKMLIPYLV
jgi:protein-S-isoprenylcysteine O-methyltransferase Ste14